MMIPGKGEIHPKFVFDTLSGIFDNITTEAHVDKSLKSVTQNNSAESQHPDTNNNTVTTPFPQFENDMLKRVNSLIAGLNRNASEHDIDNITMGEPLPNDNSSNIEPASTGNNANFRNGSINPGSTTDSPVQQVNTLETKESTKNESMDSDYEVDANETLILVWTSVYGNPAFFTGSGRFKTCKYSNCRITNDRSRISKADAVVFHLWDLLKKADFPEFRKPSQKWILFGREAPANLQMNASFSHLFNATYTFRKDSDIVFNYGSIDKRVSILPPNVGTFKKHRFANGKTRLIAWIVSNCNTSSKRERYVDELRKYVPIDVFGLCGDYKCGSKMTQKGRLQCNVMLRKSYKFYLSFENSICKDFITEKVYKCYSNDVIPVILGGADYFNDLPAQSYLNVKQFPSPREVARRIFQLDQDHNIYQKYFEWKLNYEYKYSNHFCDLCAYLNEEKYSSKSYDRIDKWWNTCEDPDDFYRKTIQF